MVDVIIWYLLLTLIGLLALPMALRLLRFLPDRGLGMSRPLGLLLAGYAFWLLCSLGLLTNSFASIALVLVGLGSASFVVWRRHTSELRTAFQRIQPVLLAEELLFALAFLAFCLFRSYSPDIAATEKPMEFGFLNAILRSRTFPPSDPWLAGYSISYYYFGYVLMAMLTRLGGTPSSVAFNLTQAASFALVITGSASIVFNIVMSLHTRQTDASEEPILSNWRTAFGYGVLGSLFVAVLGNLEGVFEFIRARGWGSDALWRWLDIRNLQTTAVSRTWYPDDSWWWWRATRLLHDRDLAGASQEVISEFPFFSYLLGDNHPHVLALPFVLMAVALAFNVLLGWFRHRRDQPLPEKPASSSLEIFLRSLWPGGGLELGLYALLLGALIFLNTWDYPIYLALFLLACLTGRLGGSRTPFGTWVIQLGQTGALLAGLGIAFYLPFLISFRSQAGGIGWCKVKTQLQQFALMFGPFLAISFTWLAAELFRSHLSSEGRQALSPWSFWSGTALLVLALAAVTLGWWVAACALLALAAVTMLILSYRPQQEGKPEPAEAGHLIIQLLLLLAFGLVLVVEFIYLRDIFNSRMNTVFKFYYQAWVLLALASAAGMALLVERLRASHGLGKAVWFAGLACITLLVAGGLLYPVMAVPSRAGGFTGRPSLDGTAFLKASDPAEYAAIAWLQANAPAGAVMVEAPGGQYSEYNQLSAYSGVPTLLGWGGHELQWRGNYDIPAAREPDIEAIYTSNDLSATRELLQRYSVDYVILGPNERSKYNLSPAVEAKFDQLLSRVFQQDDLIIYGWRD